ncbi:MAG TPA: NAD(P)H-dependent oxidoreductase [Actinomycetota bacterium]|nr:NAD(P)H-dependent oxidoreductase [Actinomycetota bacterium]
MDATPRIVGIGGTTRAGSSTEKALTYALDVCREEGATTVLFSASELVGLPFYAPEHPERTPGAIRFVEEIRAADGLIIGSPGYHGGISGLIKNALDYTEDLREDGRPYLTGLPVGCIATGAGWQGTVSTLQALRDVVHALRGWPTPMGAALNTASPCFTPDGQPSDEKVRFQLSTVANEVMSFTAWRGAGLLTG